MQIKIHKELQGSILDIGGGGIGLIGRVYSQQVTAIDNRQDEKEKIYAFRWIWLICAGHGCYDTLL